MIRKYKILYIIFLYTSIISFIVLLSLLLLSFIKNKNLEQFIIKEKGPQIINGMWCENEECNNDKKEINKKVFNIYNKKDINNIGSIGEQGACMAKRNGKLYWGNKLQNMGDICYISSIDGKLHNKKLKNKSKEVKKELNINDIINKLKKDGNIKRECIPESDITSIKKEVFKKNPKCSESYYIKKCEPGLIKLVCDNNYYYGLKRGDGKNIGCVPITSNLDFECQKANYSKYYNNKETTYKGCSKGYIRGTCSSIYKDKIKIGNNVSNCMNYDPSNNINSEMNKYITDKCELDINSKCNNSEYISENRLSKCYEKTTINCEPNYGRVICYN